MMGCHHRQGLEGIAGITTSSAGFAAKGKEALSLLFPLSFGDTEAAFTPAKIATALVQRALS